ncbi:MAG: protoheme IX farnesyltransferase [Planctomycetia bacterium]|nr:protoheme IX farnesyltransferase [Planctomycetia bacterium]
MTPPPSITADFAVPPGVVETDLSSGAAAWAADISRLTRPRIAVMVLATVVTAMWLTAGRPESLGALAALLVGTVLVTASSSIANQILERDTDGRMPRTASRPIVAGRLAVGTAWMVAAVLLVAGSVVSWMAYGWQPAVAAGVTWLLYVVLYTPLKRITPLNTAVGAVAGAMPVAIGWLAASGPQRLADGDARGALAAAALATVLYLWQFPHFMAIAWLYRSQYAAAGLRMLTVVDPTGLRAAGQSLAAALAMIPAGLVLAVPSGSIRLFLAAAVAGIVYLLATVRFAIRRDDASARILLLTSLGSLLGLLTAAVVFGKPV